MANNLELSRRIKKARQLAGLSQKELASMLNFSDKTVSAYETGRAIPPLPTLGKIAEITNYPIESIIGKTNGSNGEVVMLERKLDEILVELKKISQKL